MRRSPTPPETFLPVKPVALQILLALGEGDCHGYGVVCAVRDRSGGQIQLETGPFYRHLKRLIDDGLVEETRTPRDADPRRGAYYRLTRLGEDVIEAESRRLAEVVAQSRRLGFHGGRRA